MNTRKICPQCFRSSQYYKHVKGRLTQFCSHCGFCILNYQLSKAIATRHKNRLLRERALRRGSVLGMLSNMPIVLGLMCIPLFAFPQTLTYVAQASETASSSTVATIHEEVKPIPCEEVHEIEAKVTCFAKEAGVDPEIAHHIISKESQYIPDARGDMKILKNGHGACTNKKSPLYGKPAHARGIAQVTSCWFSHISDADADDPNFALPWMMTMLKEGKCGLWSTCPKANL